MAAKQSPFPKFNFVPLAKSFIENSDMESLKLLLEAVGIKRLVEAAGVKEAVEAAGVKQAIEAVGVDQALAAIGEEEIVANLSPQRRERLRQLLQEPPAPSKPEV